MFQGYGGLCMQSLDYAFKVVCIDENNPIKYGVLDDVNISNILEVGKYLKENYLKYDLNNCKWIIIPIPKINKQFRLDKNGYEHKKHE